MLQRDVVLKLLCKCSTDHWRFWPSSHPRSLTEQQFSDRITILSGRSWRLVRVSPARVWWPSWCANFAYGSRNIRQKIRNDYLAAYRRARRAKTASVGNSKFQFILYWKFRLFRKRIFVKQFTKIRRDIRFLIFALCFYTHGQVLYTITAMVRVCGPSHQASISLAWNCGLFRKLLFSKGSEVWWRSESSKWSIKHLHKKFKHDISLQHELRAK